MIPVAAIAHGRVRPIVLDQAGWRQLDSLYFSRGATYALYQDGSVRGTAMVLRGMWNSGNEPAYRISGCTTTLPMAEVRLDTRRPQGLAVELLASTAQLGWRHPAQPVSMPRILTVVQLLAAKAGAKAHLSPGALDSLDFHAVAVPTGAGSAPTLVTSWLDSTASSAESPSATTRHLFMVADQDPSGAWVATFVHRVAGRLRDAEFRRYVDHLDLTGDGVDELIVEGWRYGGDTWLEVLGYDQGRWREVFRSQTNWCLDEAAVRAVPSGPR
jgi:hypothetical protein